jgi:ferredoxin-NADP reductase
MKTSILNIMKIHAKILNVTFKKKVQLEKDIYVFYFLRPEDFQFLPGQYIQMTLPHAKTDDRGSSRYFTISSSPTEKDYLMITSRKGSSSFKKALFGLEEGTQVQFFGPIGMFVLPEE